jgi:hypothetical protein
MFPYSEGTEYRFVSKITKAVLVTTVGIARCDLQGMAGMGMSFSSLRRSVGGFPVDRWILPFLSFLQIVVFLLRSGMEVKSVVSTKECISRIARSTRPFSLPRPAYMDRQPVVSSEVHEPGIEHKLRLPAGDHTLEIVVAVSPRDAADFFHSLHVAFQEELHGGAGIELHEEEPGIGENRDKPVDPAEGEHCFHPVNLCLFTGEEGKFVVDLPSFLSALSCRSDRPLHHINPKTSLLPGWW